MSRTLEALHDTLTYLEDIETFTNGMTESVFLKDRKTQFAVMRAFEVIGEALKRVPQPILNKQSHIDLKIVWDAVQRTPEVSEAIRSIIASHSDRG